MIHYSSTSLYPPCLNMYINNYLQELHCDTVLPGPLCMWLCNCALVARLCLVLPIATETAGQSYFRAS
uniref:Uncharacterized protein n=1 Tax=Kalanchoe fedtschenkoi TaxID=63787 RepID=A0A7N0U5L4_KALFE